MNGRKNAHRCGSRLGGKSGASAARIWTKPVMASVDKFVFDALKYSLSRKGGKKICG
jgi:hypothetical protein